VKRWGRAERKSIPHGWDVFDEVAAPSAATAVVPASSSLVEDVLGEIDDLLAERDFLIGFWQAPGE
jgi:hypothetical protein